MSNCAVETDCVECENDDVQLMFNCTDTAAQETCEMNSAAVTHDGELAETVVDDEREAVDVDEVEEVEEPKIGVLPRPFVHIRTKAKPIPDANSLFIFSSSNR